MLVNNVLTVLQRMCAFTCLKGFEIVLENDELASACLSGDFPESSHHFPAFRKGRQRNAKDRQIIEHRKEFYFLKLSSGTF